VEDLFAFFMHALIYFTLTMDGWIPCMHCKIRKAMRILTWNRKKIYVCDVYPLCPKFMKMGWFGEEQLVSNMYGVDDLGDPSPC